MFNKYLKREHISERKIRYILKYFCFDDATTTSKLTGISRNSINKLFNQICVRIVEICEGNIISVVGEIEVEESYFFGGRRKGKHLQNVIENL